MDFWELIDKEYYGYTFKGLILINFAAICFYLSLILWLEYFRFNRISSVSERKSDEENNLERPINDEGFEAILEIKDLNKHFGQFHALKDFNADFHSGSLFVLLGHNGAGKSTLINILAGVHKPSSGAVFFKGDSVLHNKHLLYQNLGLCDQEDVFYETFTVQENLLLVQNLKRGEEDLLEIREYLSTLGMEDKLSCPANQLSGGQKRKLCLAMALIGKSKLVILDEPTAGMDVFARKEVWRLLEKVKEDRCIILTTHSMDEAELVSDEIGIMAEGELIRRGTALELKNKIGDQFTVTLLKTFSKSAQKEEIEQNQENLFSIAKSICKDAKWKGNTNESLQIVLNCDKDQVLELFNKYDAEIRKNNLDDFLYNPVSLEDFFLSTRKEEYNANNHIESISPIEEEPVKMSIFKEIFLNTKLRLFLAIRDYKEYLINIAIIIAIANIYVYFFILLHFSIPSSDPADTFNLNMRFAYFTDPFLSSQHVSPFIPPEVSPIKFAPQSLDSPEQFRSYLIEHNFHRNDYHVVVYFKSASKEGVEAFLMQNKMLSLSAMEFLMRANAVFNPNILSSTNDYLDYIPQKLRKIKSVSDCLYLSLFLAFPCFRILIQSLRQLVHEREQNIIQIQNIME